MFNVKDFKKKVKTIFKDSTMVEAAALMIDSHVGDLIVVDHNNPRLPLGIVTDRDIVRVMAKRAENPAKIQVEEAMSAILFTVSEKDEIDHVVRLMRANGVARVPIVDEAGNVSGIISSRDLLKIFADEIESLAKIGDSQIQNETGQVAYGL